MPVGSTRSRSTSPSSRGRFSPRTTSTPSPPSKAGCSRSKITTVRCQAFPVALHATRPHSAPRQTRRQPHGRMIDENTSPNFRAGVLRTFLLCPVGPGGLRGARGRLDGRAETRPRRLRRAAGMRVGPSAICHDLSGPGPRPLSSYSHGQASSTAAAGADREGDEHGERQGRMPLRAAMSFTALRCGSWAAGPSG